MKSNIRYSIAGLILPLAFFVISLLGFLVLLMEGNLFCIIYGICLFAALLGLGLALFNVQWYAFRNGSIVVRSLFGIVKHASLADIKQVFRFNAAVLGSRGLCIRSPHLVLCLHQSVTKAEVRDAYNRPLNGYIILPATRKIEQALRKAYFKSQGTNLTIT